MSEKIVVEQPWKIAEDKMDTWHSMCSYLGAFPPSLAQYFIRHFTKAGDLVYDPFSGRGTTLLEAIKLNRNVVATDLNPIALTLSKAKSKNIPIDEVLKRIEQLENSYDKALYLPEAKAESDDIHQIFHPQTLAQLCYLKRRLLKRKSDIDELLLGACLGILHGGERKDGTSGYASISMPNTFSMSPEYVRKFVQQKKLQRVHRDVFAILKEKIVRLYSNHHNSPIEGTVIRQDVRTLDTNEELKVFKGKASLILTSPPYLGVVNYARQNWIRSWFLDEDPEEVHEALDDDLNLNEWVQFANEFIRQLKPMLNKDGVGVFVIGDVARSKNSIIPLAREFVHLINDKKLFKYVWVLPDRLGDQEKTTRIWGETKGSATAIDRIVIVSDVNPFKKVNPEMNGSSLDYEFIQKTTKEFV